MAIDGNNLGDAIKAGIDGLADKTDREAIFRAIGNAIADHHNPDAGGSDVGVTDQDTTPGKLDDKIAAGNRITKTVLNPSGDESLRLSVDDANLAIDGDPQPHDGSDISMPDQILDVRGGGDAYLPWRTRFPQGSGGGVVWLGMGDGNGDAGITRFGFYDYQGGGEIFQVWSAVNNDGRVRAVNDLELNGDIRHGTRTITIPAAAAMGDFASENQYFFVADTFGNQRGYVGSSTSRQIRGDCPVVPILREGDRILEVRFRVYHESGGTLNVRVKSTSQFGNQSTIASGSVSSGFHSWITLSGVNFTIPNQNQILAGFELQSTTDMGDQRCYWVEIDYDRP